MSEQERAIEGSRHHIQMKMGEEFEQYKALPSSGRITVTED